MSLPWHLADDLSKFSAVNLLIWLDNAVQNRDYWTIGLIERELDARNDWR